MNICMGNQHPLVCQEIDQVQLQIWWQTKIWWIMIPHWISNHFKHYKLLISAGNVDLFLIYKVDEIDEIDEK